MLNGKPLNGVLFLLLLVFLGASVSSFLGLVVSELVLGIPLLTNQSLLDSLANPELLPALRVLQVLQGMGMLVIPALIYILVVFEKQELGSIFGKLNRQSVLVSLVFFMVAFPIVNYLAGWNLSVDLPTFLGDWMEVKESQAGELTALFLDMPTVGLLIFNLIMIALIPAVGEELIFRGIIQRGLIRQFGNPRLGIWLAAILFSAIHLQFLGFVPRMLMGVAMGYLFYWSGNLWYPMIAHFTNNAVSVVLAYSIQHGMVEAELENAGLENGVMAAFSLLFCMMLLYLFKQHEATRPKPTFG